MKKIMIHEEESVNLDGNIDSAINTLKNLKEEGWTGLDVSTTQEPYDDNTYPVVYVTRSRLETDEEYYKRTKKRNTH